MDLSKDITVSRRIRELAGFVRKQADFYDLCCDHGKVALLVYQANQQRQVYCVDRSERAIDLWYRSHFKDWLLTQKNFHVVIAAAESIRFSSLRADFLLAGIGIKTILNIVSNLFPDSLGQHRLIISPEKDSSMLRRYLRMRKFRLLNETVVYNAGRFREILVIEATGREIPERFDFDHAILNMETRAYQKQQAQYFSSLSANKREGASDSLALK